jgi:hypothetical protein
MNAQIRFGLYVLTRPISVVLYFFILTGEQPEVYATRSHGTEI